MGVLSWGPSIGILKSWNSQGFVQGFSVLATYTLHPAGWTTSSRAGVQKPKGPITNVMRNLRFHAGNY